MALTPKTIFHFIINFAAPTIKIDFQDSEAEDPQQLIPQVNPVPVGGLINPERENKRIQRKLQHIESRCEQTRGDAAISKSDRPLHGNTHTQPCSRLDKITPRKSLR